LDADNIQLINSKCKLIGITQIKNLMQTKTGS